MSCFFFLFFLSQSMCFIWTPESINWCSCKKPGMFSSEARLKWQKQDWCFFNALCLDNTGHTVSSLFSSWNRGSIKIINSHFSLVVWPQYRAAPPSLHTGCHKLQEHGSRFQEVPWQSIFWSICAFPQKQPGLRYCTNAHRNNGHQGKSIMRGICA